MTKHMDLMIMLFLQKSLMMVQNMGGSLKKMIKNTFKSTTKHMDHMIKLPLPSQKTTKHT
jgi:hypothetical protein